MERRQRERDSEREQKRKKETDGVQGVIRHKYEQ